MQDYCVKLANTIHIRRGYQETYISDLTKAVAGVKESVRGVREGLHGIEMIIDELQGYLPGHLQWHE